MKIKMNNMNISKLYKFKLETKDSKTQKLGISVNQFDSILFRVNIVENKLAKNITGCNVSIIVAKENGELERQTDNIEITNSTQGSIDIYLKNSCVDTVGVCLAQIVITDDNETIRTAKFIYTVNEILDAEIINEATDKLSAVDDLDKILEELYKQTEENINILNEKIENFGDLFSGDYNDLINKPEIPVVDIDKDYVDTALNEKVDKIEGKGLSSNDYTNEDKEKVATFIPYIHPDDANTRHISDAEREAWNESVSKIEDILIRLTALENK